MEHFFFFGEKVINRIFVFPSENRDNYYILQVNSKGYTISPLFPLRTIQCGKLFH